MNWLKEKWSKFKKLIVGFLVAIGLLGVAVGADIAVLTKEEEEFVLKIQDIQIKECEKGHCKQVSRTIEDNIDYEVQEYKTPSGEVGYQIIIYDGDLTRSYGYGVEETSRTYTIDKSTFSPELLAEIQQ